MRSLKNIFTIGTLALMMGLNSCSGSNGQQNIDAGTNQNDSSIENKLNPINPSTVSPANGSSYSFSNSIVRPGFTVPDESEGHDGTYDSGITATGDNGTPSDSSDDWSRILASESAAPGDSLTGRIDLSSECGSAGNTTCKDGEKVTFNFKAAEENYQVEVSFDASVAVKYVEFNTNITENFVQGQVVGQDTNGEILDGEIEITAPTIPGGMTGETWFEIYSNNAMSMNEVDFHNVSVRVRRVGGEWSSEYTAVLPVDYTQARTVINGLELALTEDVARDMGVSCFNDQYDGLQVPQASGEDDYGVEVNTALGDSQQKTTEAYNCVEGILMAHIDDDSLRSLNSAEGETPGERLLDAKVDPETADQVQVYFGRALF